MATSIASPCAVSCSLTGGQKTTGTSRGRVQAPTFVGLRLASSSGLAARKAAQRAAFAGASATRGVVSGNLSDYVGGDLVGLDLGQWVEDVERFGSVGFFAPAEGGAELRYATSLKYAGYHLMNVSARGLGDPEAYLLKVHGVRPPHLGKQPVARFYLPAEVDYRLSALPAKYKGLLLWVGEAKVLARNELQFLALLPVLRPNVKVVVEMGPSRKFYWKPMKDLVGLPSVPPAQPAAASASPAATAAVPSAAKTPVATS